MITFDLKKLSQQSGKSEVEIAKYIIHALAVKAKVFGIPQHVQSVCGDDEFTVVLTGQEKR